MSGFAAVLAEARVGGTPETIAARLGLARDLVASMLDQGERLGLVGSAQAACGSCVVGPSAADGRPVPAPADGAPVALLASRACAGCPLARRS